MSTLLQTKLTPPRLPRHYVTRQRLLDQLDAGARGRLTLIRAPVGYGKTTLVTDWVSQQKKSPDGQLAWLSLEAFDDEPARFLRYFIGAWQSVDPDFGTALEDSIHAGPGGLQPPEARMLLDRLINQLVPVSRSLTLVLDDWHTITDSTIQWMLQYWIEHVPAHVHTVITSRVLPDMPLGRWRMRGELSVIDAHALRFTTPEVGQFLRDGVKLKLTDQEIAHLVTQTEGWIGALQLIALSFQSRPQSNTPLTELPSQDDYLFSFLAEEVVNQQPDHIRDFLLTTGILNRFNVDLCDAVTGRSDSRSVLEEIERQNLFVISPESHGGWHRYHPLLSDYLRSRLAASQPQRFAEAHARAFTWWIERGSLDDAVEHGLAAKRHDDVAQLLAKNAEDLLWQQGRSERFANWCRRLPEEVLATHPKAALSFGWTFVFRTAFDELNRYVQRMEVLLSANQPSAEVASELNALKAEVDLYHGDIEGVLSRLTNADIDNLTHPTLWSTVSQVRGYAERLTGDVSGAIQSLQLARERLSPLNNLALWIYASGDLAETHKIGADLSSAEAIYREIFASQPEAMQAANPFLELAWIGYGSLHFRRNRLNDALESTQRGVTISRAAGKDRTATRYGLETLARIRQAQGGWDDTVRIFEQIDAIVARKPSRRISFQVASLRAELHILQGEHASVTDWAASFPRERPSYLTQFQFHSGQLVYGRWLMRRDPALAAELLGRCHAQALAAGWKENQLTTAILQASAAQQIEETAIALNHLREAIDIARPGGYLRPFVEQAVAIAPLLRELARREQTDPFIGAIQAAFLPVGVTTQPLVDPLTPREMEILKLIGDGLTNPQIAERLIIATGTVARHTNNLFGKLGASNRTEASLFARRLGLL